MFSNPLKMNPADITPVVLTFNEQDNIARCLAGLHWADKIIVLDSGSTDETAWICRSNPRVEWHVRHFDTFAGQWNHARGLVPTRWMMALDADYVLPPGFEESLSSLPEADESAWRIPFVYCLSGHPLRATVLPPRATLFRADRTVVLEDGHTQIFQTEGKTGDFTKPIWHDDRKPFARWWSNQIKYAHQEADKLRASPWALLAPQDKLRAYTPFAPVAMAAYCLLAKGLILDVPYGWVYTAQRILAELLLLRALWFRI